jgi:hypothetical protein
MALFLFEGIDRNIFEITHLIFLRLMLQLIDSFPPFFVLNYSAIMFAHYVVKNWTFQTASFIPANVAIKCACGVGTGFENQSQDCVQHVERLTEKTRISFRLWMLTKS